MVVLKENDSYSKVLKKIIEENWTFNKYEFTTEEKLKVKYKNRTPLPIIGFFEGFDEYVGSYETKITTGIKFFGFVTVFKTKKNYNLDKDVVQIIRLSTLEKLTSKEEIEATLTREIQETNNFLIVMSNSDNKTHSRKAYWKYINKKDLTDFRSKKILILDEDLNRKYIKSNDLDTKKYNYKLVSQERINKAILNKEDVLIYYSPYSWGSIAWAKNSEFLATVIKANVNAIKEFRKR